MKRVCAALKDRKLPLGKMKALEFFAREGDWQTAAYANEVGSLTAWEIDSVFKEKLKKNLPNAEVKITDSFLEAESLAGKRLFDFIVIDNPQNCFGPEGSYCEHFEAIPLCLGMLNDSGVIVFNINRKPFDYDKYEKWKSRRSNYYSVPDASELDVNEFLLPFYSCIMAKYGFDVIDSFEMERNSEYLSYLVYVLKKF